MASLTQNFFHLLLRISIFLPAITIHEFSHALSADLLGDSTPRRFGRLTLNPLAHLNPLGTLLFIFTGIGWANPVIMDPSHFKYPRLYSVITAFAGPFSNFLFALVLLYIKAYLFLFNLSTSTIGTLHTLLDLNVFINVMLGVFNILPIPPLDGGHLVRALIPTTWLRSYLEFEQISLLILLLLLMLPHSNFILISLMNSTMHLLQKLVF